MSDTVKAAHVLADIDPNELEKKINAFCKDKNNVVIVYSTTVVPIGGHASAMQSMVVTSVHISWTCTAEELKSFRTKLGLMIS